MALIRSSASQSRVHQTSHTRVISIPRGLLPAHTRYLRETSKTYAILRSAKSRKMQIGLPDDSAVRWMAARTKRVSWLFRRPSFTSLVLQSAVILAQSLHGHYMIRRILLARRSRRRRGYRNVCDEICEISSRNDEQSQRRSLQFLERATVRQQLPGESPHLLRGVLQTAGRFPLEEIEIR